MYIICKKPVSNRLCVINITMYVKYLTLANRKNNFFFSVSVTVRITMYRLITVKYW